MSQSTTIYSPAEAGRELGCSPSTVKRLAAAQEGEECPDK